MKPFSKLDTTSNEIYIDGVYEIQANETFTISSDKTFKINPDKKYVGFKVYGRLKFEGNEGKKLNISVKENQYFNINVGKSGSLVMNYCDFNVNSKNDSINNLINNYGDFTVSNCSFKVSYVNCTEPPGKICNEDSRISCLCSNTSKNVSINECDFTGWNEAICLRGTGNSLIKSCNIYNNKVGIKIAGYNDYTAENNIIKITKNQHIDSNGIGIYISRSGTKPIHKKLSITSNSFDNNKQAGIYFFTDKLQNIFIKQNIFSRNGIDKEYRKIVSKRLLGDEADVGPICINVGPVNESNNKCLTDSIKNINSGYNVIKRNNNLQGIVLYGKLDDNMTLAPGNYRYILLNVTIAKGAQLTILSGVEASIQKKLTVKGSLMCLGKKYEDNNVYIMSEDYEADWMLGEDDIPKDYGYTIYCSEEGVIDAVYTQFLNGGVKISDENHGCIESDGKVTLRRGCKVSCRDKSYNGIKIGEKGKLTTFETEIQNSSYGVITDGQSTIIKCNIHDNNVGVKITKASASALIGKCEIDNNSSIGVESAGNLQLYNSHVSNSNFGVYVTSVETDSNRYSKALANTIESNGEGVHIQYFTMFDVQYNNFIGNRNYGVNYIERLKGVYINVSNNYWGHSYGPSFTKYVVDAYGKNVLETFTYGDNIGLYDDTLRLDGVFGSAITDKVALEEDKYSEDSFLELQNYINELEKKNFENSFNPANGNYTRDITDLLLESIGININISRMYNSNGDTGVCQGVFGKGWRFYYISNMVELADVSNNAAEGKVINLPGGEACSFQKNSDGTYTSLNSRNVLTVDENNHYILKTKDCIYYKFDEGGSLYEIEDKKGNKLYFSQDQDFVSRIWDDTGRKYLIDYDSRYITKIEEVIDGKVTRTLTYKYIKANKSYDKLLESVTDANGNIQEKYVYDSEDRLCKVIKGNSVIEEIIYYSDGDYKGKIKRIKNKDGLISDYSYNESKNCVTIKDSTGYTYDTFYNSQFSTTYTIDNKGNYTSNSYTISSYLYDKDNRVIGRLEELKGQVDKFGFIKAYDYDKKGNVIKEYFSEAITKSFEYDAYNNVIKETDENGNFTFYIYDDKGQNIVKIVRPINGKDDYNCENVDESKFYITKFEYYDKEKDSNKHYVPFNGLVKQITKSSGSVIRYEYDKYGNKIYEIVQIDDTKYYGIKYEYDVYGNKISQTNPYLILNPNESISVPSGTGITRFTYDKKGNKLSETNAANQTTKYLYDAFDNMIGMINPNDINRKDADGKQIISVSYVYNQAGKLISQKDLLGNVKEFSYDENGNKVKEKNTLGGIYLYSYDSNGRVIKIEFKATEDSQAFLLEEDEYFIEHGILHEFDRILTTRILNYKKVYTDENKYCFTVDTYDFRNQLMKHINIKTDGIDHEYEYDKDMIISENSNVYDSYGNLIEKVNEKGVKIYFRYDVNGKMIRSYEPVEKVNASDGSDESYRYRVSEFVYDKDGNKIKERIGKDLVNLDEDIQDYMTENSYCDFKKNIDVNFGLNPSYYEKSYTYNKIGQVLSETDNAGKKIEYTYDIRGNIINKKEYLSESDYLLTEYGYDNVNRRISDSIVVKKKDLSGFDAASKETIKLTTSYTYDNNNNVIKVVYRDGSTLESSYDALNRVIQSKRTVKCNNKAVLASTEYFSYLANTENITESIDALGNKSVYKYDKLFRLVEKDYLYKNSGGEYVLKNAEKYGYNLIGDEIEKCIVDNGLEKVFVKTYDYNGKVILEQCVIKDAVNRTVQYYPAKAYKYDLLGNVIKEIDGQQYNDAKGSTVEEKINNAIGTEKTYNLDNKVVSILKPEDKKAGKKYTIAYDYDAYGNTVKETDSYGNEFIYYLILQEEL